MSVLAALLVAAASFLAASSLSRAAGSAGRSEKAALHYLHRQLVMFQRTTWNWQRLTGAPRARTYGRVLYELSVADARRTVLLWRRRANVARLRAQHPPHLREWLCIHHFEGSWQDTSAPYYGGLQMDLTFQRHYGGWLLARKGTADHWTPLEQIWVAERAFRSGRGFFPWPNTARYCGLI